MSKLCDIEKMYGKDLGISVTNAPSTIVKKNSKRFIKNSLLISTANLSENENEFIDDGYPSLFAIDYEGNASQLTYAIQQGNGFYVNDDDHLEMNIDKLTIQEKDSKLYVDTDNLNKCANGEYGVVKIEEEIQKNDNTFPKSTYISVNGNGTLYLADSFYDYMWKYVKNQIIDAIQPLIPKNYSGYLIRGYRYDKEYPANNPFNSSQFGEHVYESNLINIDSAGAQDDFGFYYTSGENISTSLDIVDPENSINIKCNFPAPTITPASNYYNVITYGHEFRVIKDQSVQSIPPLRIIIPPNFHRSGNSFIRKDYTLAISVNGESNQSEWKNRKLYFHFSQDAGNYSISLNDANINVADLLNGSNISLKFSAQNFPTNILSSIKELVKYNVSLIWDKDGIGLELWSGEIDLNNIVDFTISWSSLEKNGLTELLNPTLTTDDNSQYKISNLYMSKKYTLRISVLNTLKNSEISRWDYDFAVNYITNNTVLASTSTIRNIYLSEVCIGNDDSYVVVEDVPTTGTIGLDWVYANNTQTRGIKRGINDNHGEKIDRINSLFYRKDTDRMTLLFDFQYKDEDINALSDETYDLVFREDSFTIKLELLADDGSVIKYVINNTGEKSYDVSRYEKSARNPNDDIIIDITDISENSKNKNIKITFRKIIDPSIFIDIIRNEEDDDNYYNFVYMNVIVANYYMTSQSFRIKVDVDSLVMNTIPYSFEGGIVDESSIYYLNYIHDEPMQLFGSKANLLSSVLYDNENYSIQLINENKNHIASDVTINNENKDYAKTLIFNNNEPGKKYDLLLKIVKDFGTANQKDIYLKYLQFGSNIVDTELPAFIINNITYHYIYLSTYSPYDNVDNYNVKTDYEEKRLTVDPSANITINNFLVKNRENGININNNCITLEDDNDKTWYSIIQEKYKIDSNGSQLLTIRFGDPTSFDNVSVYDLTENLQHQNTNYSSKLYEGYDTTGGQHVDGLYDVIKKNAAALNVNPGPVNVYPHAIDKTSDAYAVTQNAAPQQLNENYKYNQESLTCDMTLPMYVEPTLTLMQWLYKAYQEYKWYNNKYDELGDTTFINEVIGNIFNDLLLNQYELDTIIIRNLLDSLINNINDTQYYNNSGNIINFCAQTDLNITVCINRGSYDSSYNSQLFVVLRYDEDIEDNGNYATIHYRYDDTIGKNIPDDNGPSTLSASSCEFKNQDFTLQSLYNSIFVDVELKSINYNNLLLSGTEIKLSDFIYYLDPETLYPEQTDKKTPTFEWSEKSIMIDNDNWTTIQLTLTDTEDLEIATETNTNNPIVITATDFDVTIENNTITLNKKTGIEAQIINAGDHITIEAERKEDPDDKTGNKYFAKTATCTIVFYSNETKATPMYEWPSESIELDVQQPQKTSGLLLNNPYDSNDLTIKYKIVIEDQSSNPANETTISNPKLDESHVEYIGGAFTIDSASGVISNFNDLAGLYEAKSNEDLQNITITVYAQNDSNNYFNAHEKTYKINLTNSNNTTQAPNIELEGESR